VTLLLGERILTFQKDTVTSEDEGTTFFPYIRNHASNNRVSNHRRPGSAMGTLRDPPSLHPPHITLQLICTVSISIFKPFNTNTKLTISDTTGESPKIIFM